MVKKLSRELKSIGFLDGDVRKNIIRVFSGILTGNETQEEIEKNQKEIFRILMTDNSSIKEFLMDNIGLSDETIALLNNYLSGKEFYDLKILFENLGDFFKNNYKTIDFVVYRYNNSKNTLDFFSGRDSLATNISINDIMVGEFINEKKALESSGGEFFLTLSTDENFGSYGSTGSIKIKTKTDVFIFSFGPKESIDYDDHELDKDILKIKKLFSKYGLSTIINNLIKYINSEYKDKLTGLFNRSFISSLPKNIKYSVLFLDLDNFKRINDTYGHQNGDFVLKEFAGILKDSVRPRDKVCRISGDEFIILVPTNNSTELEAIIRRVNSSLDRKEFSFLNNVTGIEELVKVTTTIGKSSNMGNQTLDDIINKADLEMLDSKGGSGTIYRVFEDFSKLNPEEQREFLELIGKK